MELAPLSVGTGGAWQITAPGVRQVHLYLYFDGEVLYVQSASTEDPPRVNDQPAPDTWTALSGECNITFGQARPSSFAQRTSLARRIPPWLTSCPRICVRSPSRRRERRRLRRHLEGSGRYRRAHSSQEPSPDQSTTSQLAFSRSATVAPFGLYPCRTASNPARNRVRPLSRPDPARRWRTLGGDPAAGAEEPGDVSTGLPACLRARAAGSCERPPIRAPQRAAAVGAKASARGDIRSEVEARVGGDAAPSKGATCGLALRAHRACPITYGGEQHTTADQGASPRRIRQDPHRAALQRRRQLRPPWQARRRRRWEARPPVRRPPDAADLSHGTSPGPTAGTPARCERALHDHRRCGQRGPSRTAGGRSRRDALVPRSDSASTRCWRPSDRRTQRLPRPRESSAPRCRPVCRN